LLSPSIYPRSCYFQKQMKWKLIQLCFWIAGRVNYMFFLPDKLIILAALTLMFCRQSNTVLSCNISHRRCFFPVSVTLYDCRSILYISLRVSNDIPGLRLKLSFEERAECLFIACTISNCRMSQKCWISTFKWSILIISYKFNLTIRSPDNTSPRKSRYL
jgi:hypothetical protein